MPLAIDLISDLHRESWNNFDWTGQATSPYCIVAGDVARDRALVIDQLEHLSECYSAVFYIDGNDEHKDYMGDLSRSYRELTALVKGIKNVVYLHSNVLIVDDVAILGTNGWWTYDFDPTVDMEQGLQWIMDYHDINREAALEVRQAAWEDAAYLINSVKQLQSHAEVKSIIIVSHTVPSRWLVDHDIDLQGSWRFNTMGSSVLDRALDEDHQGKVKTWCFGHYHGSIDRMHNNVRYVNNCRGRGDTNFHQAAYYPKRIVID